MPDEVRLLIRAVKENTEGHWAKVASLSLLSPVKCTFRFNGGSFHGVRVGQVPSAYIQECTVDKDTGRPVALGKVIEYCETSKLFLDAVREFKGSRLDIVIRISGDSFLGASLTET